MAELGDVFVLLLAGAYALGVSRAWRSAGRGRIVHRSQVAAFAAGMVVVFVALAPPFDSASHRSLTGHMVQHVLLISAASPLIAIGAPVIALLWALPAAWRARLLPPWRHLLRGGWGGWARRAAFVIVLQSVVMWAWHAPPLFDAALRHDSLHGLEHISFLVTSVAMWSVLAPMEHARRGGAALAVFVASFPGTALGAAMLVAPRPWYPPYSGVHAMGDQQLAGVIMWSFAGLVYVLAATVLFGTWLNDEDRTSTRVAGVVGR